MTAHQPTIHNPNVQARDDQKRDEARREELEKRRIEEELHAFDSHGFYAAIDSWLRKPVVQPVQSKRSVGFFGKQASSYQPLPVPRAEFRELYSLSKQTAYLLSLLKGAEHRGFECPYIHQANKEALERAMKKCGELKEALSRFHDSSTMVAKLLYLLHGSYARVLGREIERFFYRLEALFLLCRQAEFAQDLVKIRRAVTYRTGYVLGPETGYEKPFRKRTQ